MTLLLQEDLDNTDHISICSNDLQEETDDDSLSFSEQAIDSTMVCIAPLYTEECSSKSQLQTLLDELTSQYKSMEKEIEIVMKEHIPNVIKKLTGKKESMDKWNKGAKVFTAFGSAAGVTGILPGVGLGVAAAGSIVSLIALISDCYNQHQTENMTKELLEEFKINCESARIAFETVMLTFTKFCKEYAKYNPQCPELKKLQYNAAPKFITGNNLLEEAAKQPALPAVTAIGEIARAFVLTTGDEGTNVLVSFVEGTSKIAGTIGTFAIIFG